MNIIKRKALAILESGLLKNGAVLDVRTWNPATFVEIDLHLPEVNMDKWDAVQHIKVKVAECTYRDYTPTLWDAETRTCTLLINSSQSGPGSQWASSIKKGDPFSYVGLGSTSHKPVPGKRMLFLGDSSSVGHFLALRQLAEGKAEIFGALSFIRESHCKEFSEYFGTGIQTILEKSWDFSLVSWLEKQHLTNEIVYIAGHTPTAVALRKYLRQCTDFKGTIRLHGFWS